MKLLASVMVLIGLHSVATSGQPPPPSSHSFIALPSKQFGHGYNNASRDVQVHLEVYIDLVCPDARAAFPTVKKVAEHYGRNMFRLTVHSFPLPYHRNAFIAAQGITIVSMLTNDTMTWKYMQLMFDVQPKFSGSQTANKTEKQIISAMGMIAAQVGVSPSDFLKYQDSDGQTRSEWKHGCRRGVAGTPWFFINDVAVMADARWTVEQWQQLIDPLFPENAPPLKNRGTQKMSDLIKRLGSSGI